MAMAAMLPRIEHRSIVELVSGARREDLWAVKWRFARQSVDASCKRKKAGDISRTQPRSARRLRSSGGVGP